MSSVIADPTAGEINWVGAIPAQWKRSRVGFEGTVKARLGWKGLKAEEYVDDGYVFLSTPNIKQHLIDFKNVNFITEQRYLESPEIMLQEGDVLIAKDGSTLGISNVVRSLPRPATVNSSIAVVRPKAHVDGVFLCYFFQSHIIQSMIQRLKDGMGVPHLFQDDLRKIEIVFPPLDVQRSISLFLDRKKAQIDELIGKKQRQIELLQEKRQALISEAVTKGLNPSVPTQRSQIRGLGYAPSHWVKSKAKYLIYFITSGSRGWAEFYSDEGDIFIQSGNLVGDLKLDVTSAQRVLPPEGAETSRTQAQKGDVLVCVTGAYTGNVAYVDDHLPRAYVNQHVALVRCRAKTVVPRFLAYLLHSHFGQTQLLMNQYGGTKQGLGLDDLKEIELYLPPISEQNAIVEGIQAFSTRCDRAIALTTQQIVGLREYRQTLITAAVTGKIDVTGEE